MARTRQGGSILSFVVIGGIMALLLIGGVYFVRRNLAPTERNPQVATSEDERDRPAQDSDNDQEEPAQEDQPEQTASPDPQEASDETDLDSDSDNETAETPGPTIPGGGQTTTDLPTTGPPSLLVAGAMLSTLTAIAIAYVQSRRLRVSL